MKARIFLYFAVWLFVVACIDVFVWRYEPGTIEAGQTFIYWSHVEQTPRAWLMLPFIGFLGLWLVWRKLYLGWISTKAMILFSIALCLLCFAAPFSALGNVARHLQSKGNYSLYYQYEGIGDLDCDYVLVRCDSFGLCQFVKSWQVAPVCLGNQAPIRLEDDIRVFIHGELVFEE